MRRTPISCRWSASTATCRSFTPGNEHRVDLEGQPSGQSGLDTLELARNQEFGGRLSPVDDALVTDLGIDVLADRGVEGVDGHRQ